MKRSIYTITIVILLLSLIFNCYLNYHYNSLECEYELSRSNEKALMCNIEEQQSNIRALTLNLQDIKNSYANVNEELVTVKKRLKVKEEEIKLLQSIKVETSLTDTLIIRDTIFKYESFKLDTLLGDKWGSLNLKLEYPNNIGYTMKYTNDLDVVAYTQKEIIGPPKNCWFLRLFQKKHNIIKVEVTDNNPYSNIVNQQFIIIE